MRRRLRRPATQFLRAGHRARIFASDEGVQSLRFRAATLKGDPVGRVEVETFAGGTAAQQVFQLGADNAFQDTSIRAVSIVPEHDTAITFEAGESKGSMFYLIVGAAFVIGATVWTLWEAMGGASWL